MQILEISTNIEFYYKKYALIGNNSNDRITKIITLFFSETIGTSTKFS